MPVKFQFTYRSVCLNLKLNVGLENCFKKCLLKRTHDKPPRTNSGNLKTQFQEPLSNESKSEKEGILSKHKKTLKRLLAKLRGVISPETCCDDCMCTEGNQKAKERCFRLRGDYFESQDGLCKCADKTDKTPEPKVSEEKSTTVGETIGPENDSYKSLDAVLEKCSCLSCSEEPQDLNSLLSLSPSCYSADDKRSFTCNDPRYTNLEKSKGKKTCFHIADLRRHPSKLTLSRKKPFIPKLEKLCEGRVMSTSIKIMPHQTSIVKIHKGYEAVLKIKSAPKSVTNKY